MKSGLRKLAEEFSPAFFLTPNQDVILADIPESRIDAVQTIVDEMGLGKPATSTLRTLSMVCPALPTCGLAITEAERRLPDVISQLEAAGLGEERVTIRMSGCPNSCSRPPVAELGLIGKSVNGYNLHVGGSPNGSRLAFLLREDVPAEEIPGQIELLIRLYREHGTGDEAFGDFCHRLGDEQLRLLLEEA